MAKKNFRSAYADQDEEQKTGIVFMDDSLAHQSSAEECDINNILRNYANGVPLPVNSATAQYGDFSDAGTYQEAMNIVLEAREQFDMLPSKLRERFLNDPQNFLDFVNDESNREEAQKLGLLAEPKKDDPIVPQAPQKGSGATEGTPDRVPDPKAAT